MLHTVWLSDVRWVIVTAAQQTLAELEEGVSGAAAQQTLAELVEGVRAGGGGVRLSIPTESQEKWLSKSLLSWWRGVGEWHSQTMLTVRERSLTSYSLAAEPDSEPRGYSTESECCLLNIVVETSTEQSREECFSGVRGEQHQDVL